MRKILSLVLIVVVMMAPTAAFAEGIVKTDLKAYDADTGRPVSESTENIILILQASMEEQGQSYPVSIRDTLTVTDLTGSPVNFTIVDQPRGQLRFPGVTGKQTYYYATISLDSKSGAGVIVNVELADTLNRFRDLNFSTVIPFNKRQAVVSRITRPATTP